MADKAERIAALLKLNDDEFKNVVDEYILGETAPTLADHEVFRSDELIERTEKAMTDLIADYGTTVQTAPPGSARRASAIASRNAMSGERKDIRPLLGKLRERKRKDENPGLQRRAWQELARRYPEEFIAIKR